MHRTTTKAHLEPCYQRHAATLSYQGVAAPTFLGVYVKCDLVTGKGGLVPAIKS